MERSATAVQIKKLEEKIASISLPQDLKEKANSLLERLKIVEKDSSFFIEYDNISRYIDWVTSLPWQSETKDILDLNHARQVLDKNHFGLADVKEKILEYLFNRPSNRCGRGWVGYNCFN